MREIFRGFFIAPFHIFGRKVEICNAVIPEHFVGNFDGGNFIGVARRNFLHALFEMRFYFFVALSLEPCREEMIVTKRVFARLDIVLFAKFHAQIGGRTAIHFFGIFIVSRMPFRRLGGVPVERHG